MSADILERLDFMLISRRSDEDAIIRDARAEIVRLRGEVEARISPDWVIGYFPADVAEEVKRAVRDAFGEWNALSPKPAPAMPNGVEALALIDKWMDSYDHIGTGCSKTGALSEKEWAADRAKIEAALRAADNRDAAGVETLPPDGAYMIVYDDQDMRPETFARSGARDAALYRFEQISGNWNAHLYAKIRSNTRDVDVPDAAPAAVPAGEAVASDDARLHAATLRVISSHLRACPPYEKLRGDADCIDAAADFIMRTPQPADGEVGAALYGMFRALVDAGGATTVARHGAMPRPEKLMDALTRGMLAIERMFHPERFELDEFPRTAAHPPAPVQAAPQEGGDSHAFKNFHRSLCARFGYTHDENDWRRDLVSLEEHIARMAANPSACELVVDDAMVERACRNHFPDWDMYGPAGKMVRSADIRRLLTAALQHRGDSRGGEG